VGTDNSDAQRPITATAKKTQQLFASRNIESAVDVLKRQATDDLLQAIAPAFTAGHADRHPLAEAAESYRAEDGLSKAHLLAACNEYQPLLLEKTTSGQNADAALLSVVTAINGFIRSVDILDELEKRPVHDQPANFVDPFIKTNGIYLPTSMDR
jgi:hypothetical protein